jgi:predicted nucleotidyltransferase
MIQKELGEFIYMVKEILGEQLRDIIVYGSYARGDFNETSDIDIMILVGLNDAEIKQLENTIYDDAFDLELKYGKSISPILKNQDFFEYWSDTLPFYRNIKAEGVRVLIQSSNQNCCKKRL